LGEDGTSPGGINESRASCAASLQQIRAARATGAKLRPGPERHEDVKRSEPDRRGRLKRQGGVPPRKRLAAVGRKKKHAGIMSEPLPTSNGSVVRDLRSTSPHYLKKMVTELHSKEALVTRELI